jgi:hypothetical protein
MPSCERMFWIKVPLITKQGNHWEVALDQLWWCLSPDVYYLKFYALCVKKLSNFLTVSIQWQK